MCPKCNKQIRGRRHNCIISPLDKNMVTLEDKALKFIVVYDIECAMSMERESLYNHCPVLLVSETICNDCWNVDGLEKNCEECDVCGVGLQIFESVDCVKHFGDYLYQLSKVAKHCLATITVIAHNAKG